MAKVQGVIVIIGGTRADADKVIVAAFRAAQRRAKNTAVKVQELS